MVIYAKSMQVRLTTEQPEQLAALAQKKSVTVEELVREALALYQEAAARERREAALERLSELDAPVADWPQIEADIERGVLDAD